MKKRELFTMGYEGRDIDEFVERLEEHDISRLIDVRDIPISRKKGFSKSALGNRLEAEGIEYVHIKALGCPSDIRNKYKADGDHDYFIKAFTKYLSQNTEAIKEAYEYISDGNNCLMCFERSHTQCHRSIVAEGIRKYSKNKLKVVHI